MRVETFAKERTRKTPNRETRDRYRKAWRIVHLLGNPWTLNALASLNRSGLKFHELTYFLCRSPPKRARVDASLRALRETLSEPALGFHIAPYSRTSQLAADLRKLEDDGYLMHREGEWYLFRPAFDNIVYEWERHQDASDLEAYRGEEVARFGIYIRVYGLKRTLLSEGEMRRLDALANGTLRLARQMYRLEWGAKARAWERLLAALKDSGLPLSVTSRVQNKFWFLLLSPMYTSHDHYPMTEDLILAEMIEHKEEQLVNRSVDGTIDETAWKRTAEELDRKYIGPPPEIRADRPQGPFEMPRRVAEPPFASADEESIYNAVADYVGPSKMTEKGRRAIARRLTGYGMDEETLSDLGSLWGSALRGLTVVVTTPKLPFTRRAWFFDREKAFFGDMPPRDTQASDSSSKLS